MACYNSCPVILCIAANKLSSNCHFLDGAKIVLDWGGRCN